MSDYYVKEALKANRYAAAARELRRLSRSDPRVCAYLLYCSTRRLRPDRLRWILRDRFFKREGSPKYVSTHPHFLDDWRDDARIPALVGADEFG